MSASLDQGTQSAPGQTLAEKRLFYLQTLYEAGKERALTSDASGLIDTHLLLAMGSLGVASGFLLCYDKVEGTSRIALRGSPPEEIDRLAANAADLAALFPSLDSPRPAFAFQNGPVAPIPLLPPGVRLLLRWIVDDQWIALLGLGERLLDAPLDEADRDFLINLAAGLGDRLSHVLAFRATRALNADLGKKNAELLGLLVKAGQDQAALDRRAYHLRTLCDTTLELSGMVEATSICETFLLLLLGGFGVREAALVVYDFKHAQSIIRTRGLHAEGLSRLCAEEMESVFFESLEESGVHDLVPMSARTLSRLALPLPGVLPMRLGFQAVFALDESCIGFLALGSRLSGAQTHMPDETDFDEDEVDLILTHINNFMVFLKNARSFETIKRLNTNLEKRNADLQRTLSDLGQAKGRIEILESAKARIKAVIDSEFDKTRQVTCMDFAIILLLGLILGLLFNLSGPNRIPIVPESWNRPAPPAIEAKAALASSAKGASLFVDARPPEFYKQKHLKGAVNAPPTLFDFVYAMRLADMDPDKEIIVYGGTFSRLYDEEVAHKLSSKGHGNVRVLAGGMEAWERLAGPVEP